jgi:hypothetical protein
MVSGLVHGVLPVSFSFGPRVIPGRAKREPGISRGLAVFWIPGSPLRGAPE